MNIRKDVEKDKADLSKLEAKEKRSTAPFDCSGAGQGHHRHPGEDAGTLQNRFCGTPRFRLTEITEKYQQGQSCLFDQRQDCRCNHCGSKRRRTDHLSLFLSQFRATSQDGSSLKGQALCELEGRTGDAGCPAKCSSVADSVDGGRWA